MFDYRRGCSTCLRCVPRSLEHPLQPLRAKGTECILQLEPNCRHQISPQCRCSERYSSQISPGIRSGFIMTSCPVRTGLSRLRNPHLDKRSIQWQYDPREERERCQRRFHPSTCGWIRSIRFGRLWNQRALRRTHRLFACCWTKLLVHVAGRRWGLAIPKSHPVREAEVD